MVTMSGHIGNLFAYCDSRAKHVELLVPTEFRDQAEQSHREIGTAFKRTILNLHRIDWIAALLVVLSIIGIIIENKKLKKEIQPDPPAATRRD